MNLTNEQKRTIMERVDTDIQALYIFVTDYLHLTTGDITPAMLMADEELRIDLTSLLVAYGELNLTAKTPTEQQNPTNGKYNQENTNLHEMVKKREEK